MFNFLLVCWSFFLGPKSEFSVAEVRLQQGGLYPRFMSEAEGDLWAGLDAWTWLCEQRSAAAGDFQAQWLTRGEDERVRAAE